MQAIFFIESSPWLTQLRLVIHISMGKLAKTEIKFNLIIHLDYSPNFKIKICCEINISDDGDISAVGKIPWSSCYSIDSLSFTFHFYFRLILRLFQFSDSF